MLGNVIFRLGLSMIFVPVIWVSFDFRPCKNKKK